MSKPFEEIVYDCGKKYRIKRRFMKASFSVDTQNESKVDTLNIPGNVGKISGIKVVTTDKPGNIKTTKRYYGTGDESTINNAYLSSEHTALSSEHIESKQKLFSVNTGANEFPIYAHPKRIGIAYFEINKEEGGFDNPEVVTITDPDTGYSEEYFVWRGSYANQGNIQIAVS